MRASRGSDPPERASGAVCGPEAGDALESMPDTDDLELAEHRSWLTERALYGFMAAAAVPGIAFALMELTGSWLSLALLLIAPYFLRKSREASRALEELHRGEFQVRPNRLRLVYPLTTGLTAAAALSSPAGAQPIAHEDVPVGSVIRITFVAPVPELRGELVSWHDRWVSLDTGGARLTDAGYNRAVRIEVHSGSRRRFIEGGIVGSLAGLSLIGVRRLLDSPCAVTVNDACTHPTSRVFPETNSHLVLLATTAVGVAIGSLLHAHRWREVPGPWGAVDVRVVRTGGSSVGLRVVVPTGE